jgi:hypothetical protein
MEVEAFPGCCNAVIIHGFGSDPNAQRLRYKDDVDPDIDDQEAFVDDTIYNHGQKLIVCTTTSFQEDSNKMLKRKGFQRTKSMDKSKHSESKLIMWWRRPGGA